MIWLKRILGVLFLMFLALVGVGIYINVTANGLMATTWEIPEADIQAPWPLSDGEVAALRAEKRLEMGEVEPNEDGTEPDPLEGVDLAVIAKERAIERGKALVVTRLGCHDCHGADFAGNVVMDVPPVGGMIGPNITLGEGGRGEAFDVADFERIVRHGVDRDGGTTMMPAIDYEGLSDKEVSDVWMYVQSFPAVDQVMKEPYLGPVLKMQLATGSLPLGPFVIDHDRPRPKMPPEAKPNVEFGKHITMVCRGCHGMNYSGGPIQGGDPSWPPAGNLTPHGEGIADWSEADFIQAMRSGKRPDGSAIDEVMPWKFMAAMPDLELKAMFAYLKSLPATPTGER